MFWRQLREKYSHSGLVSLKLRHILSEYRDLLCKSPYSVQMREKFAPEESSEHRHFLHSGQVL